MNEELYIAAHERLIEEYLNEFPCATWHEAYRKTADFAHTAMIDALARQVAEARLEIE